MDTSAEDFLPYEVDFRRVNELIREFGLRAGSMAVWQGLHDHLSYGDIDLLWRLIREIDGLLQCEQVTR